MGDRPTCSDSRHLCRHQREQGDDLSQYVVSESAQQMIQISSWRRSHQRKSCSCTLDHESLAPKAVIARSVLWVWYHPYRGCHDGVQHRTVTAQVVCYGEVPECWWYDDLRSQTSSKKQDILGEVLRDRRDRHWQWGLSIGTQQCWACRRMRTCVFWASWSAPDDLCRRHDSQHPTDRHQSSIRTASVCTQRPSHPQGPGYHALQADHTHHLIRPCITALRRQETKTKKSQERPWWGWGVYEVLREKSGRYDIYSNRHTIVFSLSFKTTSLLH